MWRPLLRRVSPPSAGAAPAGADDAEVAAGAPAGVAETPFIGRAPASFAPSSSGPGDRSLAGRGSSERNTRHRKMPSGRLPEGRQGGARAGLDPDSPPPGAACILSVEPPARQARLRTGADGWSLAPDPLTGGAARDRAAPGSRMIVGRPAPARAEGSAQEPSGAPKWLNPRPLATRFRVRRGAGRAMRPTRARLAGAIPLLGDRLAVGLRTLTPSTLVRIQVPQPLFLLLGLQSTGQAFRLRLCAMRLHALAHPPCTDH